MFDIASVHEALQPTVPVSTGVSLPRVAEAGGRVTNRSYTRIPGYRAEYLLSSAPQDRSPAVRRGTATETWRTQSLRSFVTPTQTQPVWTHLADLKVLGSSALFRRPETY